ncbi:MAG: hypothetical protein R3Y57_06710 [Erysipelotrichaceae bacterium]
MNKLKWILLGLMFILLLSGCSTTPVYYSKSEVKTFVKSVFGSKYTLSDVLSYPDDSDEQNEMFEYIFTDDDGFYFSIYSSTAHIGFVSGDTAFYEEEINDNYISQKCKENEVMINTLIAQSDIECTLGETYLFCNLESYTQIQDVSELIEKIDAVLQLEYDYSDASYTKNFNVNVYIKPNNEDYEIEGEWKESYKYRICSLSLSKDWSQRLQAEDVLVNIERSFVYKIRAFYGSYQDYYVIEDDLLYKYPAEYLKWEIEEISDYTYTFGYDIDQDNYWITDLDPCQNFAGVYNYTDKGSFQALVEWLGGTYSCDQWEAQWTIGDDSWTAQLITDDDKYYKDFILIKNGQIMTLNDPEDKNNGTVSGRGFSVEDLEKMLNIEFEINQKEAEITIN